VFATEISPKPQVVHFSAAPGGRYQVRGVRTSTLPLLGTIFDWTAWVVDLRTGEVVGGEPPAKAGTTHAQQ
jgi:hypothetical protein